MDMNIHEDRRTFREFYPDAAMRHQVHYAFAHRFLPQYVHQNPFAFFSHLCRQDLPGGAMEPIRFLHSRWSMFEEMSGLSQGTGGLFRGDFVFRHVSDLTMSMEVAAGRPVVLVKMPPPEGAPGAFFVAIVLLESAANPAGWPREVQARVFTLEAQVADEPGEVRKGVLCEWQRDGNRGNFGRLVPAEREALLEAVAGLLLESDAPKQAQPTASGPVGGSTPPLASPPSPEARKPWWKLW